VMLLLISHEIILTIGWEHFPPSKNKKSSEQEPQKESSTRKTDFNSKPENNDEPASWMTWIVISGIIFSVISLVRELKHEKEITWEEFQTEYLSQDKVD
jgi:hypothetical protein